MNVSAVYNQTNPHTKYDIFCFLPRWLRRAADPDQMTMNTLPWIWHVDLKQRKLTYSLIAFNEASVSTELC